MYLVVDTDISSMTGEKYRTTRFDADNIIFLKLGLFASRHIPLPMLQIEVNFKLYVCSVVHQVYKSEKIRPIDSM